MQSGFPLEQEGEVVWMTRVRNIVVLRSRYYLARGETGIVVTK